MRRTSWFRSLRRLARSGTALLKRRSIRLSELTRRDWCSTVADHLTDDCRASRAGRHIIGGSVVCQLKLDGSVPPDG